MRFAAAAAFVVLSMTFTLFGWLRSGAPAYETALGEQRTVTLPDGSSVTLNAMSRIEVRFTEAQRMVNLVEGQALFRVAHNPARPFVVQSQGTSVRAVGTQFDVYRKGTGTLVTVVEGRVAVSSQEPLRPATDPTPTVSSLSPSPPRIEAVLLSAGEQVTVSGASIVASDPEGVAAATAWTQGLMIFDAAPLSEVISEFNKQNVKPLTLEEPDLGDLRISGTFPVQGGERLTLFLHDRFGVTVREGDAEVRISRR